MISTWVVNLRRTTFSSIMKQLWLRILFTNMIVFLPDEGTRKQKLQLYFVFFAKKTKKLHNSAIDFYIRALAFRVYEAFPSWAFHTRNNVPVRSPFRLPHLQSDQSTINSNCLCGLHRHLGHFSTNLFLMCLWTRPTSISRVRDLQSD